MNAPTTAVVTANDPSRPESFERRILFAVTGLSPQVVTETLFGLCFPQSGAPFVPTEIHVLTTSTGAEKIEQTLLDPETGQFHALLRDYGLSGIAFDRDRVHIVRDAAGNPMDDIRSPEDNERTADAIIDLVRGFASDRQCALHISLAGGRKTMGFFAGYALSLFGRVQDRLSHVLVNTPFEQMPTFFYPPPQPRIMQTADGATQRSSAEARIDLADIPVVRLLEDLPEQMLKGDISFSAAVKAAQGRIGPVLMEFDVPARSLRCGARDIRLPPQLYAFYLWHARRAVALGDGAMIAWEETEKEIPAYLETYLEVLGWDDAAPELEKAGESLRFGFFKDPWAERISNIHRKLRSVLGTSAAEPYCFTEERIPGGGRKARRGLRNLPADRIVIRNAPPPRRRL